MLVGIVWNGIGLLCLYFIVKIIQKTRKKIRGETIKKTVATFLIGTVSGAVGIVLAVCFCLFIDSLLRFDPINSTLFIIRLIFVSILIVLGAYSGALAASRFLTRFCIREVTVPLAILVSLLLVAQPIFYGWFMQARAILYG